jgi:hypothetical protein
MSAFDEIASDAPSAVISNETSTEQDENLFENTSDPIGLYSALLRAGVLVLGSDTPSSVGKLLHRICTEEVHRVTVLELRDEDARRVLDTIQLVGSRYCVYKALARSTTVCFLGSRQTASKQQVVQTSTIPPRQAFSLQHQTSHISLCSWSRCPDYVSLSRRWLFGRLQRAISGQGCCGKETTLQQ